MVRWFLSRFATLSKVNTAAQSPCDPCRSTFIDLETEDGARSRAARLDEARPDCQCQVHSVSEFSSGPVDENEVLIRLLVSPQHMHRKTLLPRASALTDAERSGLSTFREKQATREQIRGVAEALVMRARSRDQKAGIFGVLRLNCGVVRAFRGDSDPIGSYCVYDTGLRETPSHAEIFQRVAGADDALIDERRNKLFAAVKTEFVPVSKFEDGLLLDLAPKT